MTLVERRDEAMRTLAALEQQIYKTQVTLKQLEEAKITMIARIHLLDELQADSPPT